MARALVRGWGQPVLCTDLLPGRAEALAEEVGGEAVATSAELAQRADFVLLCHKPAGLYAVAADVGGAAKAVVSILGATPLAEPQGGLPRHSVVRMLPSTPVEVANGVCCHARDPEADRDFEATVLELFGRVGPVVTVDEPLIDAAMGLMSCRPGLLRAGRRGADRRRRAPRPAGRGRAPARHRDDGRDRGAPAAPRRGHARRAPGGDLPRRVDRTRAGRAGAGQRPDRVLGRSGRRPGRWALIVLATARGDVADFVSAVILVYTIIIFVYILSNLVFAFGGRVPYNRWSDAVLSFLRDVCEPYLRIFRKVIPQFGPFDFSPIVAIIVLQIVGGIIVGVIRG